MLFFSFFYNDHSSQAKTKYAPGSIVMVRLFALSRPEVSAHCLFVTASVQNRHAVKLSTCRTVTLAEL